MSISNDEWEDGRSYETVEGKIMDFLRKNNQPYNQTEICNALGYQTNSTDIPTFMGSLLSYWLVDKALEKLIEEGSVEGRIIKTNFGDQIYYKAMDRSI